MSTNHGTGSWHPASCLKQVVSEPALELLTFNVIIFYVAAPVSAALLFLSLFFLCGVETIGDPYCRSCHYCW